MSNMVIRSLMSSLTGNRSSQYSVNSGDGPGPASTTLSKPFEKQALSIRHRLEYESPGKLVWTISRTIGRANFNSTLQNFLYFNGIIHHDFKEIQRLLKLAHIRSAVRFTFENSINAAIVRIIPGPEPGCVAGELYQEIVRKIESIPGHIYSTSPMRATQFVVPGTRSKEGDQGLRPDTREGREAWPSLMIEVGYPDTPNLLHLDAEWWLLHSDGQTRFVIIATISRNPFHLDIECWTMGAPSTGVDSIGGIPKCIQNFSIDSAGRVTSLLQSSELAIPYNCIFDRSSPELTPQPIILTIPELSFFAKRMFSLLQ